MCEEKNYRDGKEKTKKQNNYTGIDIGRMFFACLIPLLHIEGGGLFSTTIAEYVARLGVPYFFSVSGFFLSISVSKYGKKTAFLKYEKRIIILFFFWMGLYFPALLLKYPDRLYLIQMILFKTPAYLWYLLAMIFAAIPFCLFPGKNRNILCGISILLYFVGTILGGSYRWLTGGLPLYDAVFLTTRNGLFFALPLMMIGEMAYKYKNISKGLFIPVLLLLYLEIYIVGNHCHLNDDRSLYFLLPCVIFVLLNVLKQFNPDVATNNIRLASSAIYVMQFGTITLGMHLFKILGMPNHIIFLLTYILTLVIPILISLIIKDLKISKYIF